MIGNPKPTSYSAVEPLLISISSQNLTKGFQSHMGINVVIPMMPSIHGMIHGKGSLSENVCSYEWLSPPLSQEQCKAIAVDSQVRATETQRSYQ